MFRFANPQCLYLLLLLPLLAALFALAMRRRRVRLRRFGRIETLRQLMPDASPARQRLKFGLLLGSLLCLILAAARPQFGSKLREEKRQGIELMLLVDVSNSMLAEDFQPNRLERTKYALERLYEGLEEDRVGLIVFAGEAHVQLPITSDYHMARTFTRKISPAMVDTQGTAIGAAIDLATLSFSSQSGESRVAVLITDGENHEDDALAAARRAAEQGIKIYVIGIGTPEGAPVRLGGEYIKDTEGNMVVSKLDEATLQQIVLETGGAYIRSTNQSMGLQEIIDRINQTEQSQLSAIVFEEFNEQYQYLLALGLALLLAEWLVLARRNRLLARFNLFKPRPRA